MALASRPRDARTSSRLGAPLEMNLCCGPCNRPSLGRASKKAADFFTFPSSLAPFASFFAPRAEPRAWLRAIAPALASLHPPPAERPVGVPYFSYVGDSILGNKAHLGAGAICSNLRPDQQPIHVRTEEKTYATGLRKFGAILGDAAEVGCNAVITSRGGPNDPASSQTYKRRLYRTLGSSLFSIGERHLRSPSRVAEARGAFVRGDNLPERNDSVFSLRIHLSSGFRNLQAKALLRTACTAKQDGPHLVVSYRIRGRPGARLGGFSSFVTSRLRSSPRFSGGRGVWSRRGFRGCAVLSGRCRTG